MNTDTNQNRSDFLRASYCALFDRCPETGIIDQLLIPQTDNEDGRQKS